MKKKIILSVIAMCAIFSCTQIKNLALINVDLPYNTAANIPDIAGYAYGDTLPAGGVSLPFPAVTVPTNSQAEMATYNTNADKIVSLKIKSLSLQMLSPANQNFDFMDSIQVYMSAPSQPETLIAYQYNIPKGQTTLSLSIDADVNLKDYFIQDSISFRVNAHMNAVPPSGAQLNIATVFNMIANPLN